MVCVRISASLTLLMCFSNVVSQSVPTVAPDSSYQEEGHSYDEDYTDRLKQACPWIPTSPSTPVATYVYKFGHTDKYESLLSYFREDMALNSHHLHYHNANPFEWTSADSNYIDRKGEMFVYVHQQALARYDAARLAAGLNRTVPYHNLRQPIKEGYYPAFPHLSVKVDYPGRPGNMLLADTSGELGDTSVEQLEIWREEILQAINHGFVFDENYNHVPIRTNAGAEILGALLQSSTTSINRRLYGNLHNMGHDLLARVCDPNENLGIEPGIIERATTTMRDPLFFRWHKEIDEIVEIHRMLMEPYTKYELQWEKVRIKQITVKGDVTKKKNQLTTYTEEIHAYLRAGFDFEAPFPVNVILPISQHEEFEYKIDVTVAGREIVQGVVRIFLAPVLDENYQYIPLQVQRRLFVELDKFVVTLKPGPNEILRRSEDSTVIRTTASAYERLSKTTTERMFIEEGHLGCGWPQNLLIPRGRIEGMNFNLFVMITDWENDKVERNPDQDFKRGSSYCGIFNEKYPDIRNMGFPFDRRTAEDVRLDRFLTNNMATTEITIFFSEQVVPRGQLMDPHFQPPAVKMLNTVSNFVYELFGEKPKKHD